MIRNGAGRDRDRSPTALIGGGGEPGTAIGGETMDRRQAVANRLNGIRYQHFAVVRKSIDGGIASHGGMQLNPGNGGIPTASVAVCGRFRRGCLPARQPVPAE